MPASMSSTEGSERAENRASSRGTARHSFQCHHPRPVVCQDRLQLAANVPACFCANVLYSLIDQIVDKQTKKVYHRMFVDELRKSR